MDGGGGGGGGGVRGVRGGGVRGVGVENKVVVVVVEKDLGRFFSSDRRTTGPTLFILLEMVTFALLLSIFDFSHQNIPIAS